MPEVEYHDVLNDGHQAIEDLPWVGEAERSTPQVQQETRRGLLIRKLGEDYQ